MRRLFWLMLAAAACAPTPSFVVGVIVAPGSRDEAAARAAGLSSVSAPPAGAEVVETAERGQTAPWAVLRARAAAAAARGAPAVFFRLPPLPAGRALSDYPEEWQALTRAARELRVMAPGLSAAKEAFPWPLAPGLEGRAWRSDGRRYLLLVNVSSRPAPVVEDALEPWRALFEARADARELLVACGVEHCLGPGRVLWLEGPWKP